MPVVERLQDAERSGTAATFSMEQVIQLFALACFDPSCYGRPISHWTKRELADEMTKQGIVESISPRHLGRLLEEAQLKPHQIRYWLTPPPDEQFDTKVSDIAQYASKWHLITDCLNIHQSESLVRLVVELARIGSRPGHQR